MIAHEIGSIHPQAIPKIVEAMDQCHRTSLQNHLRKYILEPLQSLNQPLTLIIIIDAMDEWRHHPTFIKALALLNSESHIVKFIITARLNPCASHLPGIERVSIYTYALGPISKEVIRGYFIKYLETVLWVDGRKASSADVEKLTELSGGLPVWASTVISLLSHPFDKSPPHEILSEIVGSRRQVGGTDTLGELYRNALRRLFPSSDAQKYFQRYFGAIMVIQEALSLSDFSMLAGIPSHLITRIRSTLSALQTRYPPPHSKEMIHPAMGLFHLSFLEHVQTTTTENSFAISTFDSHSVLGLNCLEQFVSLSLSSLQHNLTLRAIQKYALMYWPLHVSNGTLRSNDQWSQTEHCSKLQTISADTQRQWTTLFLKSLTPGEDGSRLENVGEDSMVSTLRKLAHWLGNGSGDHWGFQVACLEVAARIDGGDPEAWSELGRCYEARGDRMGSLQMLEEAVVAFQRALHLRPDSHPNRGESLNNVAIALRSCYRQNGNSNILVESISCSRQALALCPAPDPVHDRCLNTLASALGDLYTQKGDLRILNEVISLHRDALALRPVPHPDRSKSLNNLACALRSLHEHNGDVGALNEAISLHREALALRPVSHPGRSRSLANLAGALQSRHGCNADIVALNEAISLHREALALRPAPHPDRSNSLGNLANALRYLHEHDGDIGALNEAISLHREALALRPAPHPGRFSSLNNLAVSLHALHRYNKDVDSLKECISLSREGLALLPASHPFCHRTLMILATALRSSFEQNRAVEVLDEAISILQELLVLRAPGHRNRMHVVTLLVKVLEKRSEANGDDRDRSEIEGLKTELAALWRQHRQGKAKQYGADYSATSDLLQIL
ncbi:hypothetical protein H1R20_g15243, partial [Candolleomyces eurysporus]